MKKIECLISDDKSEQIDKICDKECYTRAEFNRRSLEIYLSIREKGLDFSLIGDKPIKLL